MYDEKMKKMEISKVKSLNKLSYILPLPQWNAVRKRFYQQKEKNKEKKM